MDLWLGQVLTLLKYRNVGGVVEYTNCTKNVPLPPPPQLTALMICTVLCTVHA